LRKTAKLCYISKLILNFNSRQEGIVSTTKLTRKEISADPIHDALIHTVEVLRDRARLITLMAAGAVVILLGVYLGLRYLDSREARDQQELSKGMDYYHGSVDAAKAQDDPYASGLIPVFRSAEAKYRAASTIFSTLASRRGSSKTGVIARYYLGLCQNEMGQKNEAISTLETVASNTTDRTVGFMAQKVLAACHLERGDAKKAQDILQNMLKSRQCDLPRVDLLIDMSRIYMAQGKKADALKTLEEAQATGAGGMLQSLVFQELGRIQGAAGN
jgi:predicted negative regulator of RcsB-dependent stress response